MATDRTHRLVAIRMPNGMPMTTERATEMNSIARVRIASSQRFIMPMKISAAASPRASSALFAARHAIRQIAAATSHQGTASSDSSTCRNTSSITSRMESNTVPKFCTRKLRTALVHSRIGI